MQLEKLQLGTFQVNARMALLCSPKIGAGESPMSALMTQRLLSFHNASQTAIASST
jgi:hypothetical protein